MRKNDLIFNIILVPIDFILLVGAGFAAYFLRVSPLITGIKPVLFNLPLGHFFTLAVLVAIFVIFLFALSGLYLVRRTTPILYELTRVAISASAGMALLIIFMFFNRDWFDSRFILLAAWIFAMVFVWAGRLLMRGIRVFFLNKKSIGYENTLILGRGEKAQAIKEQITQNKKLGLRLVDVLSTPELEVLQGLHEAKNLHRIIALDANFDRSKIMGVVNFCEENAIQFSYIPDMFGAIVADMSFDILEGLPVVSVKPSPLEGWGKAVKRTIDIAGALLGILLLAPLFALLAFIIKWETQGPVFVKLKRISNGREFLLFKFRSMVHNAEELKPMLAHLNEREDGPLFKMTDDPRITRAGKFLRARRFDELPQLFNVLSGDISLIGPRPHEPAEIKQYQDYHKKVLAIKSGVTGMAQVSGASDLPFDQEVKLDRFYIENWSLKLDLIVALKTIKLLFFDRSGV